MELNFTSVMQVISWISLMVGLIATITSLSRSNKKDQIQLENRLTKIETTLDSINQAIVKGQLVARVNDLDRRITTIEERGCSVGVECMKVMNLNGNHIKNGGVLK